jgi:hypothetical protein
MGGDDAANRNNSATAEETGEAKDYRIFYRLITAASAVFLSAGLYLVLDSLLQNAYGARSSGIIITCLGLSGLCIASSLRHLHRKAFRTKHERQLMEAHRTIEDLEQKLADVQNKQLSSNTHESAQPHNSEITLSAWAKAVEEYTRDRKNNSLPDRMRTLLRYLGGEKFSVIEQDMPGKNLSVYLKKAKEEDVPKLKAKFPVLPKLNLSGGKTVGKP